ncbi:MAG: hypothetical protein V4579_04535 [Pseudomonadota bacterium]
MLPNIDVRIANLIKAMEQVVVPALPESERLARDQAMLVVGHLRMISGQWKSALRFEQVALDALTDLAEKLAGIVAAPFAGQLAEAAQTARKADRGSIDGLEQAYNALGGVIDNVILGGPDHASFPQAAVDVLFDYGSRQARVERTWFKAIGFDPDRADLPEIADVL